VLIIEKDTMEFSDHDPSGLDLQRAWEQALEDFGIVVAAFVRIGLTRQQVDRIANPRLRARHRGQG
jgi:hypothetical protein